MNRATFDLYRESGINEKLIQLSVLTEERIKSRFDEIDEIAEYNQLKVLKAFRKNRISESHLGTWKG